MGSEGYTSFSCTLLILACTEALALPSGHFYKGIALPKFVVHSGVDAAKDHPVNPQPELGEQKNRDISPDACTVL